MEIVRGETTNLLQIFLKRLKFQFHGQVDPYFHATCVCLHFGEDLEKFQECLAVLKPNGTVTARLKRLCDEALTDKARSQLYAPDIVLVSVDSRPHHKQDYDPFFDDPPQCFEILEAKTETISKHHEDIKQAIIECVSDRSLFQFLYRQHNVCNLTLYYHGQLPFLRIHCPAMFDIGKLKIPLEFMEWAVSEKELDVVVYCPNVVCEIEEK